jgi:hypothetical protein
MDIKSFLANTLHEVGQRLSDLTNKLIDLERRYAIQSAIYQAMHLSGTSPTGLEREVHEELGREITDLKIRIRNYRLANNYFRETAEHFDNLGSMPDSGKSLPDDYQWIQDLIERHLK